MDDRTTVLRLRPANAKLLFFTFIFSLLACIANAQTPADDSIVVSIAPAYDSVGKAHRFWLGEGYRKLWAVPVKLKTFDFNRQSGGITIQKTGGGLQTKSLRYKDAAGKEWVLRSIQKFPERGLPTALRKSLLKNVLHDQVITSHPFSALTVPPFAKALGISHTNPRIVYMPDDPDLGIYRDDFRNTVLLMEEREPYDTVSTISTDKLQEKLEEDNDNSIDQRIVLRARLLDWLLGDWDRHEDQWRWEKKKSGNQTVYTPVPRDRDNVYYNTTGVLPWLVTHQYLMSRLQGFHESIRDINGFNFNSRYFDRYFLNGLTEEDWSREVAFVQQTITDDLIRRAVRLMPDTIYALSGERIIQTLMARRQNLAKHAADYYRFLNETVDLPGSDKHERFEIAYRENGNVAVSIYKMKKDNTKDRLMYQRLFVPSVTKEIRLYGMDGEDVFDVSGTTSSSIKVRMIGGGEADSFVVSRDNRNGGRLFIYDRADRENFYPQSGARIKISSDTNVNNFDKRSFKHDRSGPVISMFVNSDYGALTRVGWISEKQGFRKTPYASHHDFFVNYSTGRQSFSVGYNGEWKQVFGKNDLAIRLLSNGPRGVSNFFGTGNETVFNRVNRRSILFYRNRYDLVDLDIRIKNGSGHAATWSLGPAVQFYSSSVANNNSLFLKVYQSANLQEKVFTDRFFAGIGGGFAWNRVKGAVLPASGFYLNVDAKAMQQFGGDKRFFSAVESELGFHLPLKSDSTVVLTNRLGGGITGGEPQFYQMMQLGGVQNLRGFNSLRFTGRSMFYHNAELRVKLFDFDSRLFPASFGLVGFNDVGRVWMPGESSDVWHHGYGGGVYLAPANVVMLRVLVGHSVEITQVYLNLVFGF